MSIKGWQVAMARRMPPPVDSFVQGSTPVISFGDALGAEVATIGINPSRREFDENGWLRGSKRRLETLESLDAVSGDALSAEQARDVVVACNQYFERNPYWLWFQPLDDLLDGAVGASYRDGTACHLDLVQWATDPVWGRMKDKTGKQLLLQEGRPHLEALLRESNVRLVLAAGKAVVEQLRLIGVTQWEVMGKIPMAKTTCTLFRGTGGGVSFIGWSSNLQTQAGANSQEFRHRLAKEVRLLAAHMLTTDAGPAMEVDVKTPHDLQLDQDGHLPCGVKASGKHEFADTMLRWYENSTAETIGDVGNFGGRPCILIDLADQQAVLNVDTKRSAVAAYLAHVRKDGVDAPWQVIANARGAVNKIIFSDDPADAAGWYLYLRHPLPTPERPDDVMIRSRLQAKLRSSIANAHPDHRPP